MRIPLGENVTTLTKEGIDASLKKLERKLGVPVRQGILTRIDIATNLNVKHPPQIYLEALDTVQNCIPYNWRGTKIFRRSRQTITFYDKMAELAKKHPAVHTRFEGESNMLRYELTLRNKLNSLVGQDDLRALWLHSSKFLKKLAELWLGQYEAVIKKPIPFVPNITSAKIFRKYIEYKGLIQEGDLQGVFREIDLYSKSNNWTKNAASKLKREYKNLYADERFSDMSPVIKDLSELIYNSVEIKQFLSPLRDQC